MKKMPLFCLLLKFFYISTSCALHSVEYPMIYALRQVSSFLLISNLVKPYLPEWHPFKTEQTKRAWSIITNFLTIAYKVDGDLIIEIDGLIVW